jgi:hypothetical protein
MAGSPPPFESLFTPFYTGCQAEETPSGQGVCSSACLPTLYPEFIRCALMPAVVCAKVRTDRAGRAYLSVALVLACLLGGLAPCRVQAQNITLAPVITTVAGNGTAGYSGDNVAAGAVNVLVQLEPKA